MRKDREQATVLRRSGTSYADIKAKIGVPVSTLSRWFRDQEWSNEVARESINRLARSGSMRLAVLNAVRGSRLAKIYGEARQDALIDFSELKYHPLFISGVTAYWSHGDKTTNGKVLFSSADFRMIRIFQLFLEKVCQVQNIRIQVVIGRDFDREDQIRNFWLEKTGLNLNNFLKVVRTRLVMPKKPTNRPYYGVCNLIVNSAYLKNKILKWIELIAEEIGEEKYLEREV